MHRYLALAAAALALSLAGCASTPDNANTAATKKPMEEKEYRIGSRIPVKDPTGTN